MKLISMTDYCLEQFEKLKQWKISEQVYILYVNEYAKFLKQPLTLGMFVPCDLDGNVLSQPEKFDGRNHQEIVVFHNAKECVLFEGLLVRDIGSQYMIVYKGNNLFRHSKNRNKLEKGELTTIEDLTKHNLQLTQTAINTLNP